MTNSVQRRSPPERFSATSSDTSGAAVPGATVTATNVDTQFTRTTTTDESGQYAVRLLPLGNYKVDVTLDGFKNFSQTGIVLEVGRNARIDATIEPGNVSEVVSVVADAPLVETTSASLSRTVGQNEVLNLPLVNRDLYSLLSLTGGVTSNEASNALGGPEQNTTINGSQRAQIGSVNFQLDGGNNTAGLRGTGNPAPNPEAIQEFRVITSSYAAEYGRYPPASSTSSRSQGTNQLHGAVFEFFRNEKLNSKRWVPPDLTPRQIRSIATNTEPRSADRSIATRRSSSSAIPVCARKKPSIATPPSCPRHARGPAISLVVGTKTERSVDRRTVSRTTSSPPGGSMRRRGRSRIATFPKPICPTASTR